MNPALPICLVFLGCCCNVIFLELLIREDPSSGNIITFSQFLFIALEGFVTTTKCGTQKTVIPIRKYATLVIIFFVTNIMNNYALNFSISMPLHMIFRSGSLIANLVLGVIILKRSYKLSKYLSVLMITLGIVICTIVSSNKPVTSETVDANGVGSFEELLSWCCGITLLTAALFLSARMGIYQEMLYQQYGKYPKEALFFSHALPLPGFLFLAKDIYQHVLQYSVSEPIYFSFIDLAIPKMWVYLLGNVITQYVCITSVFVLTTECTSLTVTLVVTLRKFFSLIFSIFYFQNPFTSAHWLGTALVFGGTVAFTDVIPTIRDLISSKTTKTLKSH